MTRVVAAAASVGIFVLLCWDAGRRLPEAYPNVGRCQSDPAKYAGREVWVIPGKIASSDASGFDLIHGHGTVRVRSNSMPPEGEYAYVRGVFQADGTLRGTGIEIDHGFILARAGIIGLSLFTLFFFARVLIRTFRWRDGAFHPR